MAPILVTVHVETDWFVNPFYWTAALERAKAADPPYSWSFL